MFNLLRQDLKEGILKNKRWIAATVWFALYSAYLLFVPLSEINRKELTAFDFILCFYKGEDPMLNAMLNNEPVEFPLFWVMNFIILIFVTMHYMYNDLHGFGVQYIVRLKKRVLWWLSKCCWCFCSCVIFFAICIFISFITTLCIGGKPFCFTNSFASLESLSNQMNYYCMNELNHIDLSAQSLITSEIVVPFMVSWAICQIQMTLTLLLKPTISFIVNCSVIIISAYLQDFIPGLFMSCGMTLHNSNFIYGGFETMNCILVCLAVIITAVIFGVLIFKRYDFMEK